jgi:hypothetical protein
MREQSPLALLAPLPPVHIFFQVGAARTVLEQKERETTQRLTTVMAHVANIMR